MAAGTELEAVASPRRRLTVETEEARLARAARSAMAHRVRHRRPTPVFAAMSPVRSTVRHRRHRPPDAKRRAAASAAATDGFILVAVDVQDPGNLGALIRAAEAGGVTGACSSAGVREPVLLEGAARQHGQRAAPARRCGAVRRMPRYADPEVGGRIDRGRSPRRAGAGRGRLARHRWGCSLGGEGRGLTDDASRSCDDTGHDPDGAPVESLNVAVAGGDSRLRRTAATSMSGSFDDDGPTSRQGETETHHQGRTSGPPPGGHAARRTHAAAHARRGDRPGRTSSRPASRCARRSSATSSSRSSSGDRQAPARRRSRASSPT